MKKMLKIILIAAAVIVLVLVLAVVGLALLANYRSDHYYQYATPAGGLEAKYTALGPYEVAHTSFEASDEAWGSYEVWYPAGLEDSGQNWPLVILVNGTGTPAAKYQAVFRHLASWGFIVAGNGDENARTGASSSATLDLLLAQNQDPDSPFYRRVDPDRVGIAGHSQGGVGAIHAVTAQPNGGIYRALYTASATSNYWGQDQVLGPEWRYDASQVTLPWFMTAGTGYFDAGTAADITANEGQGICPLWDMEYNYDLVPDGVSKVMARAVGRDHGDMLHCGDAYMTAWFLYWLREDAQAGGAFFGENPELFSNPNWQDVRGNG